MVFLGFELGNARLKAQTNPLSYRAPSFDNFYFKWRTLSGQSYKTLYNHNLQF